MRKRGRDERGRDKRGRERALSRQGAMARRFKPVAWAAGLVAVGLAWSGSAAAGQDSRAAITLVTADRPAVERRARSLVVARIDLSDQLMRIYVDNRLSYTFPVSTGLGRYHTPTGRWHAQWLSPNHRSRKYHNAPMPWSVFFYRGYAVHGTTEVARLGRPASHGCVRLHPDNAKIFFDLVQNNGKANTLINVVQ